VESSVERPAVSIVFGTDDTTPVSDHVVAWLREQGHSVTVLANPADWPEVGRRVGEAVASGAADVGVVCCWTGTGVSIAANKVPGVRAALCTDAETARGARRWNDANVLALGLRLTSAPLAEEMLSAFLGTAVDDGEGAMITRVEPGPAPAGRAGFDPALDHLVYAAPDLDAAVQDLAERCGVQPVEGGRHVGLGTRNHLLGLGGGAYLEIIGPDPEQPEPAGPRPFGIDSLTGPALVTWAVRPADLDAVVARARARGHDPGDARPMSRRTPAGDVLRWRLTASALDDGREPVSGVGSGFGDGLLPFLIDWGTTVHPTASGLPEIGLVSLTGRHPDVAGVRRALAALDVRLDVEGGERPGLTAVLRRADGVLVTLARG